MSGRYNGRSSCILRYEGPNGMSSDGKMGAGAMGTLKENGNFRLKRTQLSLSFSLSQAI
jgi:hypothetical protein